MGHKIFASDEDADQGYHRDGRGRFVKVEDLRCISCKKKATKDGHDPCIANLPGVTDACCGHGRHEGYIVFENGTTIRGFFEVEK